MGWKVATVCALSVTVVSCFRPSAPAGAPCAESGDCPAPYTCSTANTCGLSSDLDAMADAESLVDARSAIDASLDSAPATGCWSSWLGGMPVLGPETVLDLGDSTDEVIDPSLSFDELTLYVALGTGGAGTAVPYRATRPTLTADFANLSAAQELNPSHESVTKVTTSMDGQELVLASSRVGGAGGSDLWRVTRSGPTFSMPSESGLLAVESSNDEYDPELAQSGLRLYFSRSIGANPSSGQEIWVAARSGPSATFGAPTRVAFDQTFPFAADPNVSPDGRVMLFTGVTDGNADIWLATRPDAEGPFRVTGRVFGVSNAGRTEGDPELTRDGCTLYYSATKPSSTSGLRRVFRVDVH